MKHLSKEQNKELIDYINNVEYGIISMIENHLRNVLGITDNNKISEIINELINSGIIKIEDKNLKTWKVNKESKNGL